MKVFFTHSLKNLDKFQEYYTHTHQVLEENRCKILEGSMSPSYYKNQQKSADETFPAVLYDEIMLGIISADIVISDVSERSMSSGYQLSYAIEKRKPLLVMINSSSKYVNNKLFFEDKKKAFFTKRIYTTKKDINKIIKNFINDNLETKKERFNLILSKLQSNYLDWMSHSKNVTKTSIIQEAIDGFIEKDSRFQEYLTHKGSSN